MKSAVIIAGVSAAAVCFFIFGSAVFFLLKIKWIKDSGKNTCLHFPVLEFYGGILMALCRIYYGDSRFFLDAEENYRIFLVFAELVFIHVIAWNDLLTMKIPNRLVLGMFLAAFFSACFFREIHWRDRTAGFFSVSILMTVINAVCSGAFGGGDIKMMAAAGAFLGWKKVWIAFIIAVLLGGGYSAWNLLTGKKKIRSTFAFGPFLCIGITVSLFWGKEIVRLFSDI